MAEVFNFNEFQIPAVGVDFIAVTRDRDDHVRTDPNIAIRRKANMGMSNFGAYFVGSRMSGDYTRTVLDFESKDKLSDLNIIKPEWLFAERNENPYVWGSTVTFTRNDQAIKMGMANPEADIGAVLPMFDVMDTKATAAEGIVDDPNAAIKNWPSEGWRSFGGKYDFS